MDKRRPTDPKYSKRSRAPLKINFQLKVECDYCLYWYLETLKACPNCGEANETYFLEHYNPWRRNEK